MKTIFQIITSIDIGGAENIAFSLTDYIQKEQSEVKPIILELYAVNSEYSLKKKKELKVKGIEFYTLGTRNKYLSLLLAPLRLYKFIKQKNPSIIHSHTDLPDFVLSVCLKMLKSPSFKIIRTIHNTELWPTHHRLGRFTEKSYTNDAIVAVSVSALEAYQVLRKKYGLTPSVHQQVIKNGINIPHSIPFPFNFNREKINIAFAGRFETQKGIDILIRALEKCSENIQNTIIVHFIGQGSFQPQIENLCTATQFCVFHGPVSDLALKLSSFDFLIMPSRHEGLALMSLEASFAKVPVIATEIPGLTETLPNKWPLLIQPSSELEILNVLETIANKQIDMHTLSAQAFEYVNDHFSHKEMCSSYANVFHQILSVSK